MRARRKKGGETSEIDKYLYCIEFDASTELPPSWIDGETLRLLNSLRSNIYVSSSMFDEIHYKAQQNTQAKKEPQRHQPHRSGRPELLRAKLTPKKIDVKPSYGFCHHCKLMKRSELLADCNYDS